MKVSDLINQLQAMPPSADVEIDLGEEFRNFTVKHVTKDAAPGDAQLVALEQEPDPPHIAVIAAKYERMADAAPDMLAALKDISRNAALDDAWLAPVRAAIAKAEA